MTYMTAHLRSADDAYFPGQSDYPACWYFGRNVGGGELEFLLAELKARALSAPPVFTNDLVAPELCDDCRAIAQKP